jgi:hypothetical protein
MKSVDLSRELGIALARPKTPPEPLFELFDIAEPAPPTGTQYVQHGALWVPEPPPLLSYWYVPDAPAPSHWMRNDISFDEVFDGTTYMLKRLAFAKT